MRMNKTNRLCSKRRDTLPAVLLYTENPAIVAGLKIA